MYVLTASFRANSNSLLSRSCFIWKVRGLGVSFQTLVGDEMYICPLNKKGNIYPEKELSFRSKENMKKEHNQWQFKSLYYDICITEMIHNKYL